MTRVRLVAFALVVLATCVVVFDAPLIIRFPSIALFLTFGVGLAVSPVLPRFDVGDQVVVLAAIGLSTTVTVSGILVRIGAWSTETVLTTVALTSIVGIFVPESRRREQANPAGRLPGQIDGAFPPRSPADWSHMDTGSLTRLQPIDVAALHRYASLLSEHDSSVDPDTATEIAFRLALSRVGALPDVLDYEPWLLALMLRYLYSTQEWEPPAALAGLDAHEVLVLLLTPTHEDEDIARFIGVRSRRIERIRGSIREAAPEADEILARATEGRDSGTSLESIVPLAASAQRALRIQWLGNGFPQLRPMWVPNTRSRFVRRLFGIR